MAKSKLQQAEERARCARLEAETARDMARAVGYRSVGDKLAVKDLGGVEPDLGTMGGMGGGAGGGDFKSAKTSRLKSSWSRGGSADSHRDPWTIDAIRKQAQSAFRNDHLVQSLVGRLQDFAVGTGPRLQVKSTDAAFNLAAEKFLTAWADGPCDDTSYVRADGLSCGRSSGDFCRLSIAADETDGDMFGILTERGTVQLVEAERVRNPVKGTQGLRLVNGIELDGLGRVTSYHVASWDSASGGAYPSVKTEAVPAEFVLHLRGAHGDAINCARPEPGLNSLLEPLEMLKNYIQDTAAASQMALLFGLLTKTERPQDMGVQLPGAVDATRTDSDGNSYTQKQWDLAPAFVGHLKPGESIEQIKPEQPTTVFGDFVTSLMRLFGANKGLPIVLWLLEFGSLNFSSAKSAVLLAYVGVNVRRSMLVRRLLRPMFRWRLALAIRRGELLDANGSPILNAPEGWDEHKFFFPPMPILDPAAQYDGYIKGLNGKILSYADVIKELHGMDFEEFMDQIEYEQEEMTRRGISAVQAPGTGKGIEGSRDQGIEEEEEGDAVSGEQ